MPAADQTGRTIIYYAAPTVKISAASAGGVDVRWSRSAGAVRYAVYYRENGGAWKRIGTTEKTGYTWKKAVAGNTYAFTVRCVGSDKKTLLSAYRSTGSMKYLAAPRVTIANAAAGIRVTWNAVRGAARYAVYYKEKGGAWNKIGTTEKTGYTWRKGESGKTYFFTVRCTDENRVNIGPYQSSGALLYIAAPTVEAKNASDGLRISWNASEGAEAYRVFYKTSAGGSWKRLEDTTGTEYTFADQELKGGGRYWFAVRCLDAERTAYISAYDTAAEGVTYVPMPVIDRTLNTDDGGIQVTWDEVPGAAGYLAYYKLMDAEDWILLTETAETSCTLADADAKAKYVFTLVAVAKDGTQSVYAEERRSMIFSNSSLVSYTRHSPNHYNGRTNIVDTITIHCVAAQQSVENIGGGFALPWPQASSNYGIGPDGRIGMYVEEKDGSWCSSSRENDNRAITIEVASDSADPYWVTPQAYASLIDLVTDICRRNGIEKLVWSTSKSDRVGHVDGCNMTCHRDFTNKTCPGSYLYSREGEIAAAVNARLGAAG